MRRLIERVRLAWLIRTFRCDVHHRELAALRRIAQQAKRTTMARTATSFTRALATRITEEQGRRLDALAARSGCSTSDALRQHLDTLPPAAGDVPSSRRRPPNATAYHQG